MNLPTASIVIRCFNEEKHIGRLIAGIYSQKDVRFEVIVVDSGSTDRTLEIVKDYPAKLLTIRKDEFSFGRSLNLGCDAGRGEFLVFISAHCYPVRTSWLYHLIAPFDDSRVALAYGKQRGDGATKFSECQIFKQWFPDVSKPLQHSPFCNNANCAIRKSIWSKQPYNEEITGLEDIDWARRILDKGYYLSYTADGEVIHIHNETPKQTFNRYYREAITFHRMYPTQRFSLKDFCWLTLVNSFSDYRHALSQGKFRENLYAIPQFRILQFWGTYRGYRQKTLTDSLKQHLYYPPDMGRVDKEALIKSSDFVSTNCDLNPTSFHIMGAREFSLMKTTAYFINCARGPLVDEPSLIAALSNEGIAGAALDVFEEEPLSKDSPLRRMSNVLLSPHNANSSLEHWRRIHEATVEHLLLGLCQ